MNSQLHKILRFAQKTGDKVIITDAEGKEPMVIMPFNMYEHLIEMGQKTSGMGLFLESEEGREESIAGLPDELFAPSGVLAEDDLALEVPKEALKTVAKPVQDPIIAPISQKSAQTEQDLPKNTDGEDLPEEEQFYLEPVE